MVDMKKDWKVIYQTHGKVRVLVIAKDFLAGIGKAIRGRARG